MKEIKFIIGDSIDECIDKLTSVTCKCFGDYNGIRIYSHESVDEIYLKITGKTRCEQKKYEHEYLDDIRRRDELHKSKIPQLTTEYISRAKGVIRPEKQDEWNRCVPIRLRDQYKGMELDAVLELAPIISDEKYDDADRVFRDQGHSGMSHSLVCCMLSTFVTGGEEFIRRYK